MDNLSIGSRSDVDGITGLQDPVGFGNGLPGLG